MTNFDSIFMFSTTKNGNTCVKAIKAKEMTAEAKSLKRSIEAIWEKTLDVTLNPSHTRNAEALPAMWESLFDTLEVTEFVHKTVLYGCMFGSAKLADCENGTKLTTKATFVKRVILLSDLMSEGKFTLQNKQSDKSATAMAKAEAEAAQNKVVSLNERAIAEYKAGNMSYDVLVAIVGEEAAKAA